VTVTIAIHPDVPEVYVKIAKNVPEVVRRRGHANVKNPRVEEIYVRSAKSVDYAVRVGVVKNPVQGVHAPALSVPTVENAVSAIKPAVAQVHVDAIHPVATIVIAGIRIVNAMNAIIGRASVHRIMVPAQEPSE